MFYYKNISYKGMTPKLGGQREKDAKVIELSLEDTFVRGSHLLTNMANIV